METTKGVYRIDSSHPDSIRRWWEAVLVRDAEMRGGIPAIPDWRDGPSFPLVAYVNEGRWVATCQPPEGCNAGLAVDPDVDRAVCLSCGLLWRIDFPPQADREEAERLLRRRNPINRNWFPKDMVLGLTRIKGENVEQLAHENLLIIADQLAELPPGIEVAEELKGLPPIEDLRGQP